MEHSHSRAIPAQCRLLFLKGALAIMCHQYPMLSILHVRQLVMGAWQVSQ